MLSDDGERVYADDFPVGEGLLNLSLRLLVFLGLVVGWINHRLVEDEEVGVGGWQTVALAVLVGGQAVALVVDGIGHREFEESVRVAFVGKESFELLFQRLEVFVLLILWVVAPYI